MGSRARGAQVSGPVPDRLAEWYGGRATEPLEPGIVLRWQSKSRGRVLRNDHRADLADDGRLWVRWHPEGEPPDAAFAGGHTGEPTTQLDPGDVADLLDLLAAEDFTDQDPYQGTDDEGGDAVAVRARLGDVEHEVIYPQPSNFAGTSSDVGGSRPPAPTPSRSPTSEPCCRTVPSEDRLPAPPVIPMGCPRHSRAR